MLRKSTLGAVLMFLLVLVSCGLDKRNERKIAYIWQPENIVEKYTDEVCGMAGEEIYILKKKDGKQHIEFYSIEGKALRTMPLDKYDITDKTTLKFVKKYDDSYLLCPIEQKQILHIKNNTISSKLVCRTAMIGYADILNDYIMEINDFINAYKYTFFYTKFDFVEQMFYGGDARYSESHKVNPAKITSDKHEFVYYSNLDMPFTIIRFPGADSAELDIKRFTQKVNITNDFQWLKIGEEFFPSGHVVISSLGFDENYLYIPRTGGMYYTETPPRPIPYEFGIDILDKNTGEHTRTLSVKGLKNLSGMAYIIGVTDKHIILLMNDFSKSFDSYKKSPSAGNWFIVAINKE